MVTRRIVLLSFILLAFVRCADSAAASQFPVPMRDALDSYAYTEASYEGWEYVDRLAAARGNWKIAYFTLVYIVPQEARDVTFELHVEARIERCAPGVYAIETPYGGEQCLHLPAWRGWDKGVSDRYIRSMGSRTPRQE